MSNDEVYRERERERERRKANLKAQLEKTTKMLEALPPHDPARESLAELVQRLTEAVDGSPDPEE